MFTVKTGTLFLLACTIIGWIFQWVAHRIVPQRCQSYKHRRCCPALATVHLSVNAAIVVSNMLSQTCRKPWRANFLAAARQGLFFIPLIFILPQFFGLLGVEMCQAVSDTFSLLATIPIMIYTFREFKKEQIEFNQQKNN